MLDTKTKPQKKPPEPASRPHQDPEPDPRPRGGFLRGDVIVGTVTGFVVALGFGGPILSALGVFWRDIVIPAFFTLAQAGLAYCT
jgi:hypothetical protein